MPGEAACIRAGLQRPSSSSGSDDGRTSCGAQRCFFGHGAWWLAVPLLSLLRLQLIARDGVEREELAAARRSCRQSVERDDETDPSRFAGMMRRPFLSLLS